MTPHMRFVTSTAVLCSSMIAIAGCAGGPPPSAPTGPSPAVPIVPSDAPPKDDGRFHHHKNYFALERVGEEAHHFTAWYSDVEPGHCEATVVEGKVSLTGCMFGGLSVPPRNIPDVPASVSAEAKLVEGAIRARSSGASQIQVGYQGAYRELVVSEMIVVTGARMMGNPVGWHGRVYLKADGALTRIEGVAPGRSQTAYGMIDIPAQAARVDHVLPPSEDGQRLVTSEIVQSAAPSPSSRALTERVLVAAREIASGNPIATIGSLYSSPVDSSVPATYDQPLSLALSIYARHQRFQEQKHADLVLRLHPRQAATEGKALATAETEIDGIRVKATATMTPFTPSTTPSKSNLDYEGRDMEATIAVHVEDDRGNVVDRSYPARGKVVGEAPALATPAGLVLPGTSSPSKEADALRWTWPGNGQATSFDFSLSPQLFASPRR